MKSLDKNSNVNVVVVIEDFDVSNHAIDEVGSVVDGLFDATIGIVSHDVDDVHICSFYLVAVGVDSIAMFRIVGLDVFELLQRNFGCPTFFF